MIFELSIDHAKPGKAGQLMELVQQVRVGQFGSHGALQGAWTSELGPVSRVVQMWAYEDLASWARVREALDGDGVFQSSYVDPVRPLVSDQERRLLQAHRRF